MRIDISQNQIELAVRMIRKLENMDFPEVTDGNKMSDLFEVTANLGDFAELLLMEADI